MKFKASRQFCSFKREYDKKTFKTPGLTVIFEVQVSQALFFKTVNSFAGAALRLLLVHKTVVLKPPKYT